MIDFTGVKAISIPEGVVKQIVLKSDGVILWKGGYKNWLPEATTTDRKTIYGGDYNGDGTPDGYMTGRRLSSSGSDTSQSGMCCSGFIPAKAGDILRFKNTKPKYGSASYVITYNSSNTKVAHQSIAQKKDGSDWSPPGIKSWQSNVDGILQITLDPNYFGTGFNAIRFSAGVISADTIVTINEEIA